jgi:hypothetical protein
MSETPPIVARLRREQRTMLGRSLSGEAADTIEALLSALENMVEIMEGMCRGDGVEEARAAIAKAMEA